MANIPGDIKRAHLVLLTLAAVALVVAAVVAVFYVLENRRGAKEWGRVRRKLAVQGESLDAATFLPPPVPDERNLALIPLFARALDYRADPQTGELAFGPNRSKEVGFEDMPFGCGGKMTRLTMPVIDPISSRMAWVQKACERAEVACALERYFLANGTCPPTLDALVPGFIDRVPVDLIAGGPMRYRQTDDGRYLLCGIGWNERDDGGNIAWTHPKPGVEATLGQTGKKVTGASNTSPLLCRVVEGFQEAPASQRSRKGIASAPSIAVPLIPSDA